MYGLQVAVGYLRVYPTLETMTDVWPTDYSSRHSSRLYASDNQRAGTSRVIHPYPGQQEREREKGAGLCVSLFSLKKKKEGRKKKDRHKQYRSTEGYWFHSSRTRNICPLLSIYSFGVVSPPRSRSAQQRTSYLMLYVDHNPIDFEHVTQYFWLAFF